MSNPQNQKKENVTILNPGNLAQTLESNFRISRDLKNIMNSTGANLVVEINSTGRVVKACLVDQAGKMVANEAHLAGLGTCRRFIMDTVKKAEKEEGDNKKVSFMDKMVATAAVKPATLKPEANGRLSELLRQAQCLEDNKQSAEDWDDDGPDGRTKKYILCCINEVFEILLGLGKHILESGSKYDPKYVETLLEARYMPVWLYEKLTEKNAIKNEMASPIDFLFPKNFLGGISFRTCEMEDEYINKHVIVTKGNEVLFDIAKEYVRSIPEPLTRDAKRNVEEYKKGIKWNLVPMMDFESMFSRYKDSKVGVFENPSLPDGEAKQVLAPVVAQMTSFNIAWNRYHRFLFWREQDVKQFWSKFVKRTVMQNWEITAQQGIKFWASELSNTDVDIDESFHTYAIRFCLGEMQIYDPTQFSEFVTKITPYEYRSCKDRLQILADELVVFEKLVKKQAEMKEEAKKLPNGTDEEKKARQAAFYEASHLVNVNSPPVLEEISSWVHVYSDRFIPRITKGFFETNFKISGADYSLVFPFEEGTPITVSEKTLEKYSVYFKTKIGRDKKDAVASGVVTTLTEKSKKLLAEFEKNEKYGKYLKPKIETFLVSTFVGSETSQDIAVNAIVESVRNQDFFEEEE